MDNENTSQIPVNLAIAGPEFFRNAALAGWWTLLGIAVLIFIYIQRYLQDPNRKQLDAEWFRKFEANQRARYSGGELSWRARDLKNYFAPAPYRSEAQGGPAGSAGPKLPLMYSPVV